jgi:F-type H+-transporting ATPase subunit delta
MPRYTAKHYATVLQMTTGSTVALRVAAKELGALARAMAQDAGIRSFCTSRAVPTARQERVLHDVLASRLGPPVYAMLTALVANRQLALVGAIVRSVEKLADTGEGVARVTVVSAVEIPDTQTAALERAIAAQIGRRPSVVYTVDPACVGGLRVTIDGTRIWDGTVSGRIARLRAHLRSVAS